MFRRVVLLFCMAAAASAVVSGCTSENDGSDAVARRVETVDSLQDMRHALIRADVQISRTQQSLDQLATLRAGDLQQTYRRFSADVRESESMGSRLNARASSLSSDSYRQISEWNYQSRTIRDEALRRRSLLQEAAAKEQHDQMVTSLSDLRGLYTQYVRVLEDVDTFAANNLTPQGLLALEDERDRAGRLSEELRRKMASLDGQLGRMAMTWRPDVPLAERLRDANGAVPAATQMQSTNDQGGDDAPVIPANSPVARE